MRLVARVCQPSTLRILIWPEASSAQNSIAAVSADGSTVCVLILRLNSSCSRSIAFVVRALRHWLGGSRAKANRRSPASSTLSATARAVLEPPLADEGPAAGFDLLWGRRVDHGGVIGGHFILQAVGCMRQKVDVLVDRASLESESDSDVCANWEAPMRLSDERSVELFSYLTSRSVFRRSIRCA